MLAQAAADDERERAREVERLGTVTTMDGLRMIELDIEAVESLPAAWYEQDSETRQAVIAQLRRCLAALEGSG